MVRRMEGSSSSTDARGRRPVNSLQGLQNLEAHPQNDNGVGNKTCLANPFAKPKRKPKSKRRSQSSSSSDHQRLMNASAMASASSEHKRLMHASQLVSPDGSEQQQKRQQQSRLPLPQSTSRKSNHTSDNKSRSSMHRLLTPPTPQDRSDLAAHEQRQRRRGLYDGEVEPEGVRGQQATIAQKQNRQRPTHIPLPKARSRLTIAPSPKPQPHSNLSMVQENSRESSQTNSHPSIQQKFSSDSNESENQNNGNNNNDADDSTCSDDDILHMMPDFVASREEPKRRVPNLLHSASAIKDDRPPRQLRAQPSASQSSVSASQVEEMQSAALQLVKTQQYDHALELFTNVLQVRLTTVGKQHPLTASAYHNLGTVHAKRSNVALADSVLQKHCRQAALDCFQAAARIARDSLGKDHPNVAVSLVRVGFVLLQARQYQNALVTFHEALRIRVNHFGRQHGLVANLLNNLGVCSMHMGEFGHGKQYLEEALKIQRHMVESKRRIALSPKQRQDPNDLSKQQLELADTLFNVGGLCLEWIRRQGPDARRAQEAEAAFVEALEIRREVLGEDDPMVLQVKGLLDMARSVPRPKVHQRRSTKSVTPTRRSPARTPQLHDYPDHRYQQQQQDPGVSQRITPDASRSRSMGASSSREDADEVDLPSAKREREWQSPVMPGMPDGLSPIPRSLTPTSTFSTKEQHSIFRRNQGSQPRIAPAASSQSRRHAPPLQISVSKEGVDEQEHRRGTRIYVAPHLIPVVDRKNRAINDSDIALANASYEKDVTFVSDASGEAGPREKDPSIHVSFDAEESCIIGDTGVDSEVGTVHYPQSWNRAGIPTGQEDESTLGRNIVVARPVPSRQGTTTAASPSPVHENASMKETRSTGNRARDDIMTRARAILQAHSPAVGSSSMDTGDGSQRLSSPKAVIDHDPIEEGVAPLGESWSSKSRSGEHQLSMQEMLRDPMNHLKEIHNEASIHLQRGDVVDAQHLFEVILNCQRHRHGPLHPDVASALHNIGITMLRAQNHSEALKAFEEAARVRKGALGKDHALVAVSLVKCGITLLLLHRFDEALWSFREALSVRKHALGALHPSTARIYNNIGCVYVEFNEFREARRAFEAALDSQRSALVNEPESVSLKFATATTLCNLGYLYRYRDMHGKAADVLREAVRLQEDVLGESHATVLSTLDSLADSCASSGNSREALKSYNVVLERFRRGRKKGSKKVQRAEAVLLYKMSRVYRQKHDRESQLECLRCALQAIRQYSNSFGGRQTDTLERRILYDIRASREQIEKEGLETI